MKKYGIELRCIDAGLIPLELLSKKKRKKILKRLEEIAQESLNKQGKKCSHFVDQPDYWIYDKIVMN